jgi:preprotein translocase subunit SecF
MEFFKDTHFDFLGRKWWFIGPSLILTLAGVASLFLKSGPRYGIDFRGGAVMDVRREVAIPIERVRMAVSSRLSGVSVVAAHDLTGSNEVLISVQLPSLQGLRQTLVQALLTLDSKYSIRSFEVIGPEIGADLRQEALL